MLCLSIDWLQGAGCCVWLLTGYRVHVVVYDYLLVKGAGCCLAIDWIYGVGCCLAIHLLQDVVYGYWLVAGAGCCFWQLTGYKVQVVVSGY